MQNRRNLKKDFKRDWMLLSMLLPAVIVVVLFCYVPMSGLIISFKNYSAMRGIFGSPWVGMKHFNSFFSSMFFDRLMRNTVLLSVYTLLIGFPFPILFALLLNEVKQPRLRKVIQTISYMPHFLSLVVVVAIIRIFFQPVGIINRVLESMGFAAVPFTSEPAWFRTLYVGSEIWQNMGWNAIIFIAAITAIDPNLYEAAEIDGANEFKKFFRIALPLAKPIIAVIALYYAFAKWNSYYTALIYLKNQKYWPLQLVLRQILIANENALSALGKARDAQLAAVVTYKLYIVRAMKYAIILIASLPMLILYPFVSKYFMQGTMVGSVKE